MNKEHRYWLKLIATICLFVGPFLQIEHLWSWGYLQYEFFGHETYGLEITAIGAAIGYYLYRVPATNGDLENE